MEMKVCILSSSPHAVSLGRLQASQISKHHRFNGYDLLDKQCNIRKPADYRDRYELLGIMW